MSLKISLKPHERIVIGGAVVQNGGGRSDLLIENPVTILRERDILREEDADTPCKKIYFTIQLMYIDEKNLMEYHNVYWKLVRDVLDAAPSTLLLIDPISDHILGGRYYPALKLAQKLIAYEQEVVEHVRKADGGIPVGPENHDVRAGARSVSADQRSAYAPGMPERVEF